MLVITEQDENQWSFSNNYVRVFAEHFKLEVKLRLEKPQDRLMLMLLMVIVVGARGGWEGRGVPGAIRIPCD